MIQFNVPVLRRIGEPLEPEEVTLDPPRSGEVLIRMAAAGVCHSCLHVADGSHTGILLPTVLGDEGAGVVEEVGPDCKTLSPGDHVILSWAPGCGRCRWCRRGYPALCEDRPPRGRFRDGDTRFHAHNGDPIYHFSVSTFSPFIVVEEASAVRIPPSIPLDVAALIGCAVTTGVGAVVNTAQARFGESVAVFGVGGVGLSAVQGAALSGCYPVIAVDKVEHKLEVAKRLGASHVINASESDVVSSVFDITEGVGADYSIVGAGSVAAIEEAIQALTKRGTCVVVGAPSTGSMVSIDPHTLRAGERRIIGSSYGSSNPPIDFNVLVRMHMGGRLQLDPIVSRRYRLNEVNEAFASLASGEEVRGLIHFNGASDS